MSQNLENLDYIRTFIKENLLITYINCFQDNGIQEIPLVRRLKSGRSPTFLYQISNYLRARAEEMNDLQAHEGMSDISKSDRKLLLKMIETYLNVKPNKKEPAINFSQWLPFPQENLKSNLPILDLEYPELPGLKYSFNCYYPCDDQFGYCIGYLMTEINNFLESTPDPEEIEEEDIEMATKIMVSLIEFMKACCQNPESLESFKNYWGFAIQVLTPMISWIEPFYELTDLVLTLYEHECDEEEQEGEDGEEENTKNDLLKSVLNTIEELVENFKEIRPHLELYQKGALEFLIRATIMSKIYPKEKRDKMLNLDPDDTDYESMLYLKVLTEPELLNFPHYL